MAHGFMQNTEVKEKNTWMLHKYLRILINHFLLQVISQNCRSKQHYIIKAIFIGTHYIIYELIRHNLIPKLYNQSMFFRYKLSILNILDLYKISKD